MHDRFDSTRLNQKFLGMTDSELCLLMKAIHFAADKHRNQRRKDINASPYINHPIAVAVAQTLLDIGHVMHVPTLAAAVLHDTIEDTETSHEDLVREFGVEVANIVMEVTDDKSLEKQERKRRQVEHARHLSDAAKQVKLGDKICNVTDILSSPPADWTDARKREYLEWAADVVNEVRGANAELEEHFDRLVSR